MSDTPRTDTEAPDLINLMEWNRFAEQGMTVLEVLTILNNRHRAEIEVRMAAEIHAMRELNAAKQELQDAVKRLSEVTDGAIESAYWSSWTSTHIVRNLFIQAAKGEP